MATWPPENATIQLKDKGGLFFYSNDFNVRWSIPAFKGYTGITCSSISMGGSIATSQGTGEAPFYIHCSASNVTCVGSRLNSSLAVNPYEHLEHRWTVTKLNGDPCEYGDEIVDPNSKLVVNPYTDQIGGDAVFLLREADDYRITLTSSDPDGVTNTITKTITVSAPTYGHLWIDGDAGNESNDGLDPWGFALANASYTESTGELTEVGGFTSYDHEAATASVSTDNYNYIYVNGHGAKRIASKASNDTIVLLDKLGSDLTGLTSSDGPKQILATAKVLADTFTHVKAGTYSITADLALGRKDQCSIGGYDGKPVLQSDGVFTGTIAGMSVGASSFQSDKILMSNISFDCQGLCQGYNGNNSSSVDTTGLAMIIIDRVETKGGSGIIAVSLQTAILTKPILLGWWGGLIDNLRLGSEERRQGVYTDYELGHVSAIGVIRKTDCDSSVLDHHWYFNGKHDNRLCSWNDFAEGVGANYCINTNTTGEAAARAKYISFRGNRCTSANWGFDMSQTQNAQDKGFFENVLVSENSFDVINGGMFYYSSMGVAFLNNALFGAVSTFQQMFKNAGGNGTEAVYYVLDGNVCYNNRLESESTSLSREVINNQVVIDGVAISALVTNNTTYTADVYISNNAFFSDSPSTAINDNSVDVTVATYNAATGFSNTTTDAGWLDPAVGDFF